METIRKVYQVKETVIRKDEGRIQTMIFDFKDGEWVYYTPNAQTHTVEQLERILEKLKSFV